MPSVVIRMENSKQENRRISKPLMEKRRRARINHSLSELKSLLLDTVKSETPRHSKMEKADLLELTVRHLQEVHRKQRTIALLNDPYMKNKFQAGYEECAKEIECFIGRLDSIKYEVKQQLKHHLGSRLDEMKELKDGEPMTEMERKQESCSCTEPSSVQELHLLPRKLPNGDLALVLSQNVTLKGPHGTFLVQSNNWCETKANNNVQEEQGHQGTESVWRPW